MAPFGPLDDLARENTQHLVVKRRADEQKGAIPSTLLNNIRYRRLNIDLGQNLDIVGVRHQKIRRRCDRTMRFVKNRGPAGSDSEIDLYTGRIIGPRPDLAK